MAEADSAVNNCGICLSGFEQPKILPCFHTFCAKCLENNVATTGQQHSFNCPICRAVTIIPKGGVKAFQTNFYVKTNSGKLVTSDVDCDVCCQQQKAKRKCTECKQYFCEQCSNIHARTSATKHHQLHVISKTRKTDICQDHLCEFTSLCQECDVFCCRECSETTHRYHNMASIMSSAREKRLVLEDLVDQSKQCTQEIESDACVMRKQNDAKFEFFRNCVENLRVQKNALITNINNAFTRFEDTMDVLNHEQRTKADEITEKQLAKCDLMKETIDKSKNVLDSGSDIELLTAFNELSEQLKTSESTLIQCVPGHELLANVDKYTSWLIKMNALCKELS